MPSLKKKSLTPHDSEFKFLSHIFTFILKHRKLCPNKTTITITYSTPILSSHQNPSVYYCSRPCTSTSHFPLASVSNNKQPLHVISTIRYRHHFYVRS